VNEWQRETREAIIGASVYLWSVDEKITFYKRIYKRHRLKKNVPICPSVNLNVGDLMRVITTLFVFVHAIRLCAVPE